MNVKQKNKPCLSILPETIKFGKNYSKEDLIVEVNDNSKCKS